MSETPGRGLLAEADPAEDPRGFRHCLGQYATGVTIITTGVNGVRAGVTANSFASVSIDPPLVLWSIAHTSRSQAVFAEATHFAINVLALDQTSVAQHFSSSVADKFAGINCGVGIGGAPLVRDSVATFECSVESRYAGGDHTIIVGRVLRYSRYAGAPLAFVQGRYATAQDHPDYLSAQGEASEKAQPGESNELLPLVFAAYRKLSRGFDQHRRAENVTLNQGRVLATLYENNLSFDQLSEATYIGQRELDDTVAELRDRKLLTVGSGSPIALTEAGRTLREAVSKRWNEFQCAQLAGIGASDIGVTRSVLTRLLGQEAGSKPPR